jgi:perosamine synthetase
MQHLATAWPQQRASSFAARVAKMTLLKLLSIPALFTLLVKLIQLTGRDPDAVVGHSARGFPDDQLFAALRQRPSVAMMKLLAHRLAHFDARTIETRIHRGREFATAVEPPAFVAGIDNPSHTYWVVPLVSPEPKATVQQLRRAGLDASQISGLAVINGEHAPADHWFRRAVFVPQK